MRQIICIALALTVCGCSDSGTEDASVPAASAAPAPAAKGAGGAAGPPDWLPAGLALPDDADIVANRSIGASTRLLQARTDAAQDALFEAYLARLAGAGYEARTAAGRILFRGRGIEQASITFADTLDLGRVLQIDVTMAKP